jgi:hypothetical protein
LSWKRRAPARLFLFGLIVFLGVFGIIYCFVNGLMPKLGPVKRKELIQYMRQLGFEGPSAGGNHEFMKRGALKV